MGDKIIISMLMNAPFCFAIHKIIDDKKNKTIVFEFAGVNPVFERTFGVKNELLTGKTVSELFQTSEGLDTEWRGIYDKIAAENGAAEFEHHIAHTGKWFKVSAWHTDETHLAITLTDITAGRQSMEPGCLKDVQQHAFWDNNLFGVMIADKNGNYVDANEEACRMTGYSCEELKSMTLFHLIAPDHIEGARAHFEQTGNAGKAYGEAAYYTKSGEKRWWNVVATRLSNDFFLGLHEDVTSRKRAEDALHLREDRLQKQNNVLLALMSRGTLFQSNLQQAIAEITKACSDLIGTERVSVWLYNEDHTEIICTNLYNSIAHEHMNNREAIRCEEFPTYFACQKKGEVIDAIDVFSDPRTCELPADYYKRHNIRSMLDTPVWFHDRLGAVLCFEHTGEQRVWTSEDVRLATSMAAFLSLCFQNEERRQAEEERESAMFMLQSALAQSPSGILIADAPDVRIRYANEAALYIRGVSETPLTGIEVSKHSISWQTFRLDGTPMPSEDLPLSRAILKGETVRNEEVIIRHASGEDRYVSANSAPIRNAAGDITAGIVVFHDITQRRYTEESLRKSEQELKILTENMTDIVVMADTNGNYTYLSESNYRLLGFRPDELLGKSIMSLIHEDDLSKAIALFQEGMVNGITVRDEFRIIKKESGYTWFEIIGSHFLGNDGQLSGALVSLRDITERKQAEDKLNASEKKFRELSTLMRLMADNMPDMLWAKNLNKEYIFANKTICRNLLNAVDTEEPLGKTDMFFAMRERNSKPDDSQWHTFGEICRDSDSITIDEMKPMQFDEFGNVKGKFLFLDVHKAPLFNDQGQLFGVVGSARDVTTAKETENQLRKLSQAVEQSPASVVITDPQGTIEYVNPKFTEITGYTLEEAIGQNPRILKSGEQTAEVYSELWKTISTGKEWKGEFHNKKKNGELFWESALITPIKNEKGEILHYLAVKEDITERKRDQEKIRISKDTYESIFNSVSEAIYVLDENGVFIDVNRGAEIMYGYTHDELTGKNPAEVSAPGMNDMEAVQKIILEVAKTGISKSFEFWGLRKNGEIFPKEVSINRGKYFGNDHMIATARDISERKRRETARSIHLNIAKSIHTADSTEELLETIRQELSQLLDTTNFFVAKYNPETDTLKQLIFHDEMDEFDEWEADQSISGQVVKSGKTVFLRGDEMNNFSKKHNIETLGTDPACWLGVPMIMHNHVGGVMVIQHYTNPYAYSEADVALFEIVAHETEIYLEKQMMIENLIRAKDQAEESDRLKSAFLANMSHEIRTPMNGILGFAELLNEPDLTGEQQEQYIALINKSGHRMLNIINDIVDISKIEAGLTELRMSESNINEQIDYIHTFFMPETDAKGLKFLIKSTLAQNEATIVTDREKLYAILANLIKNAIKYTHTGEIVLGCVREGDVLEFFVKDTGIGIPTNRQEAIFKRFVQADIEDRMAYQGAGLGLAISKAYVEMLGGKIWVESEEGIGSIFYFALPCNSLPEKEYALPQQDAADFKADIRELKILVVEDDLISEMLFDKTVKSFSKEILKARTGVEAVEITKQNPDIDLILMDIRLPEMDGYEATKQIREFNKEVIIIAQTAYGMAGDREKSIGAGCDDYITKPIKKDELQSLILKYLGK